MQKRQNILRLTESAIMIAFATVLSEIRIAHLPLGGSVTAFSMLPLIIIAYRYGTKWGLFSAGIAGLFQLILGMNNLRYGTGLLAVVAILLFDYIIAYGILGLGGIFRGRIGNRQGVEMACGAALTLFLRYLCHVLTGVTVWKVWAPEGQSVLGYSLGYNATYMLPELVITVIGALLICSFLDFTSKDITRKSKNEKIAVPERNATASIVRLTGIFTAFSGVFYSVYNMINAFLDEADIAPRLLVILLLSVVAGILIYGFGELIQLVYNISKRTTTDGTSHKGCVKELSDEN